MAINKQKKSRGNRMLMNLQHSADSFERRRTKYTPPIHTHTTSISQLIKDSPRENVGIEQLELSISARRNPDLDVVLYAAGDVALLKRRCIAVIGTRDVSPDGASRARRLARELVERGVVVVSGLAHGVDTEAMSAAVEDGGKVIGVIGTPIDQSYPAKNAMLQEEVYRNHLLISQFPSGQRVFPSNFPARNRTMALLTDASVIIEASDSSGTLHQAAECVRHKRWLCIAKSVVENPKLRWPAQFLGYPKCLVLKSTDELIFSIYGG